ncbi:MAG TPA: acetate--CoA ligase family protein [Steroidobacteraceae bacterium]|nr:acetate--CoA ligase family protein [Steroidobacteraceae bacterium]
MPAADIRRLIAPRSIALIGAGAWTDAVAAGSAAIGFDGELWRVHPSRASTPDITYYRSIEQLPATPDAAFLAVPNREAPGVAAALARRGAGGFVCFSSGFAETGTERGHGLTQDLLAAAGELPFFGPNCYGFVNYFDRVALMPDQIVGTAPERGVALICQSGTLALTLMFNDRSLPIGYLFTVGNQTRLAVEDLIEFLAEDPRVTAYGLYLEGVKDPAHLARAAEVARRAGKPIAVIKSGRTAAAARTAHSHTGALAGADAVFDAFCRQAGIARCETLGALCETLKIFHLGGPIRGGKLLIMGASGGDMAMTADLARNMELDFAPIPPAQGAALATLLGERVTIANPFDIHTYLWFDPPALRKVFAAVLASGYDAVGFMLDCPPDGRADTAAFDVVIDEYIDVAAGAQPRVALIASLPETMGARTRGNCLRGGVVPLQGQREALEALAAAGAVGRAWRGTGPQLQIPRRPVDPAAARSLSEYDGKAELRRFGVPTPRSVIATPARTADAASALGFPVVIKALGAHLEHKTELGGVALNICDRDAASSAAGRLAALSASLLIEEMIVDGIAEILVGITLDEQFGQVLVLGAGGVLTELLGDSVSLLPPWTAQSIRAALDRLKVGRLLAGFRGKPAGDLPALVGAIERVAAYAQANLDRLVEIDVNPLMVRPAGSGVAAVDVLIRLQQE